MSFLSRLWFRKEDAPEWHVEVIHKAVARFDIPFYSWAGPVDHFILDVHNGWLIDENGSTLRTRDGGISWHPRELESYLNGKRRTERHSYSGVSFLDRQRGWAFGCNEPLLQTDDGGDSWTPVRGVIGVRSLQFIDSVTGCAVGDDGQILLTNDSGISWKRKRCRVSLNTTANMGPYRGHLNLNSVCFVDCKHGWCVGTEGVVLSTRNGGRTWRLQTKEAFPHLTSVHFVDSTHGWAVGESGLVIRTGDSGRSWRIVQGVPSSSYLTSVQFLDKQNGWVTGGDGTVMRSYDGGETWSLVTTPLDPDGQYRVNKVQFLDSETGWISGPRES